MKDIAFHIADIAENSLRAVASEVAVRLDFDGRQLRLQIEDNGCGMSPATVDKITNPFYTTRTTRSIGLGIPFLMQAAEQTGGWVTIRSQLGVGTLVTAMFDTGHIDCPPAGDVALTVALLLCSNSGVDMQFVLSTPNGAFSLSTAELTEVMDGIPLGLPEVIAQVREILSDNISTGLKF